MAVLFISWEGEFEFFSLFIGEWEKKFSYPNENIEKIIEAMVKGEREIPKSIIGMYVNILILIFVEKS